MICIKKTIVKWLFILVIAVIIVIAAYNFFGTIFHTEKNTMTTYINKSDVTVVYKQYLEYETNFLLKYDTFAFVKAGTMDTKTTGYVYFSIENDFEIHGDGSDITLVLKSFSYDGFSEEDLKYTIHSNKPNNSVNLQNMESIRKKIREKTIEYIKNEYIPNKREEIKEQILLRLYKKLNERYRNINFSIKWQ